MPRDSGGNYTLPAGNPVLPNTVIESEWANTTMSDIATALTGSLSIDGSVTTPKLANAAVTTPKLADSSVTAAKLADNSVPTSKLKDEVVTTPKLATGAVTTPKLADGAVTPVKTGISGSGLVTRATETTFAMRSIVGTAGEIDVINGDGAAGNPTLSLPGTITGVNRISPDTGDLSLNGHNITVTSGGVMSFDGTSFTNNGAEIYRQNNIVGTVSQSGGQPTGAIIQQGSNGNGLWTRYADGTQVCTLSFVASVNFNTALGGSFYHGTPINWTYPAAFTDVPSVAYGGGQEVVSGNVTTVAGHGTPNSTVATVLPWGLTGSAITRNMYISLMAVGRWF